MPERETLERLGAIGATLAIHLSIANLARVVRALLPFYGSECPAIVAYRVSWPDEILIRGTLSTIVAQVKEAAIERTALILVGPALSARDFADSALYSADYDRRFRPSAETGRVRE